MGSVMCAVLSGSYGAMLVKVRGISSAGGQQQPQ